MISLAVLLLCSPVLGTPVDIRPGYFEESAVGVVNSTNEVAQHGAKLISEHNTNFTTNSANINNNVSSMFSETLCGIIDVGTRFLYVVTKAFSSIPFLRSAVAVTNSALKTEAKIAGEVGQNFIKTSQNVTNLNLRALDQIVQYNLDSFMDISDYNKDVLTDLVRDHMDAANAGYHKNDKMESADNEISEADFY